MNYWPYILFVIVSAYFIVFCQAPWQIIVIAAPLFVIAELINQNKLGGVSQQIIAYRQKIGAKKLKTPDWWILVIWGIGAILVEIMLASIPALSLGESLRISGAFFGVGCLYYLAKKYYDYESG